MTSHTYNNVWRADTAAVYNIVRKRFPGFRRLFVAHTSLYIIYIIRHKYRVHAQTHTRPTDCRPSGESKIDMIPTENRKPTLISVIISRTHQFASVCPIRVETYPFLLHPLQRVTRITSLCSVCGKYILKTERAYTLCE